jgi:ketosteroid isomerase-like protein
MSMTNMNANSELTVRHELQAAVRESVVSRCDDESTRLNAAQWILRSVLAALREGRISDAVAQFSNRFKFNDHGVALEFTDKPRLTEFFEKARELFPDTTLEIVSLFESGDQAIAEWNLAATQTIPYGSISYRVPISLHGSTIVHVENGRIVQWSDYYDQNSAHRISLAAFFTDWVEY